MHSIRTQFLKYFVLSGILLIISYLVFGSYYEEYQGFWNAFFSGDLNPGTQFNHFYFLGYIGISHVYSWFYLLFPNIQWLSVFHYLQLNIAFALILTLHAYLLRNSKQYVIFELIFLVVLFFSFFLDNILLFVYARASYILCGAAYLALIVLFDDLRSVKKQKGLFIFLQFLFLWGTLTRVESSMAVSLLLFCFAVLWYANIKKALLISSVNLSVLGLGLAGIFLDIHFSNQFHKQVEPDIETQYTVRSNVVPVSTFESYEDSIKYEAALRMFWADPEIITIPYLKSLIAEPESVYFNKTQWNRVSIELKTAFQNFKFHFIVLFFSSLLFFFLLVNKKLYKSAGLFFLYFLGFCILLIVNSYFVKMRDRTISPFLLIYFISMLFLALKLFDWNQKKLNILFSALVLFAIGNIVINQQKANILEETRNTNKIIHEKLDTYCANETLMPNPTAMGNICLAYTPFEAFDFSAYYKFYFYEASIQSIIPPFYDYLNNECHCDVWNFSNFYRYVLDENYPTKVYVVSNEDRMNVAMAYLKTFHQLDILYEKVEAVDLNENLAMDYYSKRKLYLYEISLKN